jgi:hypothetical protein
MSVTVLFVAANPLATTRLSLDEEVRRIVDKMRGAKYQSSIELRTAWAARPDDLLMSLNQFSPDVLHFSGHGNPEGQLAFVDDGGRAKLVSNRALTATLHSAGSSVQLVVLNACYSKQQAAALIGVIPCAIGMNAAIGDEAAIVFSAAFYRAIAYGGSVRRAFDQAVAALLLEGLPEESTPELLYNSNIEPDNLFFTVPEQTGRGHSSGLELIDMGLAGDPRYRMEVRGDLVCISLPKKDLPQ